MSNVKKLKKMVIFVMAFVMIFSVCNVSATALYRRGGRNYVYRGSEYKVYYNNKKLSTSSRYAVMINDNVMIPYKYFLVSRGPKMKSAYNKYAQTLTLEYKQTTVKFTLYNKYMYVNGKKEKLNTEPLTMRMGGTKLIVLPAKALCRVFDIPYTYNRYAKSVSMTPPATSASKPVSNNNTANTNVSSTLQATAFNGMTTAQFIETVGPIAQQDYRNTGVLASVTLAQAINESGWGKSGLTQKSNNMFGMKTSLSGNTWAGSAWDGKSYVSVITTEEYGGRKVKITATFRKYKNVAQSIADHSAYLANAKNGSAKRYAGLTTTKSYSQQLKILQKGGYCTWSGYVSELTTLIKKYNLTRFDK